ncbi:NDP-hexose 2,3-dehydratase family protein [Rhodohalobacter sp. 8-1]|uniref:NDP-hexose 2,3-dehydratase family protein n=1 Tax=Rhodohalobacter sp. 8-1 TaxID=3131972 RepID=UPI0030EC846F
MLKNSQNIFSFIKSAFSEEESITPTKSVIKWLEKRNEQVSIHIEKVKFYELKQWKYDEYSGSLRHDSGKFFSIDGIKVSTNWGNVNEWEQPIINQPEVGYLGIITKEFNGTLHFLMQAKIEPGNVNYVQLSPTLQATKSNYTQVHKGKKPHYLDFFRNAEPDQILLDQLQSEQGGRFLKKRNRNIIIKVDEEIEVKDDFIWLTLAQLKKLMNFDNLVNMDTRTVISGIPYGSYDEDVVGLFKFFGYQGNNNIGRKFLASALLENSLHTNDEVIQFITRLKSYYELEVERVSLKEIDDWVYTPSEIKHKENKYFKVIPVQVEIGNREVVSWSQPMVQPTQDGLCAFVCKEINGVLHFVVQAKLECGNFDIIELAPTVQCLTGNYRDTKKGKLPFLDYVLNAPEEKTVFDAIQSEEGGRFFREQNKNKIIVAGDEIPLELPENYIWMTLNQLHTFLKYNNYLNIQARSLISAISFI